MREHLLDHERAHRPDVVERGLFGAHYYLAAATPLAVLWLTSDPARWDATVPAAAALLVVVGAIGTVLPALPGVPLIFIGVLVAAWAEDFQRIGGWTIGVLAVLGALLRQRREIARLRREANARAEPPAAHPPVPEL